MADFNIAYKITEHINSIILEESYRTRVLNIPKNNTGRKCTVDNCVDLEYAKGYCNAHYKRSMTGKAMFAPIKNRKRYEKCLECFTTTTDKGGLGRCKSCYKKYKKTIIKQVLIEHLGNKCSQCNIQYQHCVYDFHHRDSKAKLDSISELFTTLNTLKIVEEALKCDLLCANCHRILHYGEL